MSRILRQSAGPQVAARYLVPVRRLFPIWKSVPLDNEGRERKWYLDRYDKREFATFTQAREFVESHR